MINLNPNLNFNHPQPQINISNSTKKEININRTNLDILLSQNDILPLLKKVNLQSKLFGRQITLSEFVQQKNVSNLIVIIINKY